MVTKKSTGCEIAAYSGRLLGSGLLELNALMKAVGTGVHHSNFKMQVILRPLEKGKQLLELWVVNGTKANPVLTRVYHKEIK